MRPHDERLVGQLAFAAVYLAAGTFASLVLVSAHPLAVMVGASGAIFGVYGLLFALIDPDTFASFDDRAFP